MTSKRRTHSTPADEGIAAARHDNAARYPVTRNGRTVHVTIPENEPRSQTSRIDRFWVVLRPTPDSEMCDVCFDTHLGQFALMVLGGMKPEDVVAMFTDEDEARELATRLLKVRDTMREAERS